MGARLKQEVIAVRHRERFFVPIVGRPQEAHLSKRRETHWKEGLCPSVMKLEELRVGA